MTLDSIKKEVERIAQIISAPKKFLPTFGYSIDSAYPHIEIDKSGMLHFIIIERGKELLRKSTAKFDELLYWIFDNVTFSMACDYELKHRIESQDCRRIIFVKQEELLGMIDQSWKDKHEIKHQHILNRHPFNDFA